MKYFQKKGQIIRHFLLFLVPYIRFLFESLKLIRQFSPRFDQISVCSNLSKYFNIFQKFLSISKFFLFHTNVSYFSTLNQKSFFSWAKPVLTLVEILHENFNFDFVCSGGVRNYFLYKAPIYLSTEDIKLFGQNGCSVQIWEPWLLVAV